LVLIVPTTVRLLYEKAFEPAYTFAIISSLILGLSGFVNTSVYFIQRKISNMDSARTSSMSSSRTSRVFDNEDREYYIAL